MDSKKFKSEAFGGLVCPIAGLTMQSKVTRAVNILRQSIMELALSSNITLKFGRIVPDKGYILLNDTAHAAIGLMSEFPAIGLVSEGTNGLKPIVKDCHELQADIVTVVDFDRTVSR